jgi:hypothetical protein
LNQYFSAVRIDEFKYIFTAEIENGLFQKGDIGGLVIMINLYTDPQEDVNVGIRHIPMITSVGAAMEFYMKDLIKYPPRFKVGFASNNPPIYDLVPAVKEMMKKNGLGRPTP